jgi:glycosyltransferase involved in cell wall biosynthesis
MDISVVIPAYNSEEFIDDTIRSVSRQTKKPKEIIIVDDGSADATVEVAEKWRGIVVVSNPGSGPNAARNYGAQQTSGGLLAFPDNDDLWHPEHLRVLASALERHPSAPAALAPRNSFQHGSEPEYSLSESDPEFFNAWDDFPVNRAGEPVLALIRRSAFERVEGWSEQHDGCADYHLWLKLSLGGELVRTPSKTAARRIYNTSLSSTLRAEDAVSYYRKHVSASRDALKRRARSGLSTDGFEVRLNAQDILVDLYKQMYSEDRSGLARILHDLNGCLSQVDTPGILSIWSTFGWFVDPEIQQREGMSFKEKTLALVFSWPRGCGGSRVCEALFKWAVSGMSTLHLIRCKPWSWLVWKTVMQRRF